MGLAVLPSRLKDELKTLKDVMLKNGDVSSVESIAKHAEWAAQVKRDHPEMNEANAEHILQQEVGKVFVKVLENAGAVSYTHLDVYKRQAPRDAHLDSESGVKFGRAGRSGGKKRHCKM